MDGDEENDREAEPEEGNLQLGIERGMQCDADLGRTKKKVKLSHEVDHLSGHSVEGRGARVGSAAGAGGGDFGGGGVKTRSRATGSRRSSMRNRR